MSSFTRNYNAPLMPLGPVEWPSIFNTLINLIEAGRTVRVTAGEALAAGEAVQPPRAADSRVFRANNTHNFLGITRAAIALGAEGFVFVGLGNEITVGSAWTIGGLVFVGTAAGSLTQTRPTSEAVPIGYANTATSIVLLRPVIRHPSPVSHHYMRIDVAASLTAVAIPVLGLVGNNEITLPRGGSIIGVSIASNATRTAGTLTVVATVNGTAAGLQAILNATNPQHHFATQAGGLNTFVAGDRLGVVITTDAAWLPTTADIVVCILVEV